MISEPVPVCLYSFVCVQVPGCRCILNCWSDIAGIGCSSDLAIRCIDVTTEKSMGSTNLFGDSTKVVIELQLCVNANSQVFCSVNSVENLAVYSVGTVDWLLLQCDPKNLTFRWVKLHHLCFLPQLESIEVTVQSASISWR